MAQIEVLGVTTWSDASDTSHITDLVFVDISGTPVLVSTNRYDGSINAFGLTENGLQSTGRAVHTRSDSVGGPARLAVITLNGVVGVLTGGGALAPLRFFPIASDGRFGTPVELGLIPDIPADLTQLVTVTLPSGRTAVYGGIEADAGIGRMVFTSSGSSFATGWTRDYSDTHADGVGALAAATIGANTYIFSAGSSDPGITTWAMDWRGFLSNASRLTTGEGLWISAPSAMETVTMSGTSYLLLSSAGSSSLSVMAISATGELTVVDHVLDDLSTRFAGATALATTVAEGTQWVVTGGSDDGISLFVILAGGRLVHVASIADTTSSTLADISALELRAQGDNLDIFVASSSEYGITRLRFDLDGHEILTGTSGNDTLSGGSGTDILIDGAGRDTLTGGADADVFVMTADGEEDRITDFRLGVDRIDLGDWPQLRSMAQLDITFTSRGFVLSYGDERLTVSTSGNFDRAMLSAEDIIGASHLPRSAVTGYPETFDPDAELPPLISTRPVTRPTTPTYPDDEPTETPSTGSSDSDENGGSNGTGSQGGGTSGVATPNADRLTGGNGNDTIRGLGGDDRIFGYAGDDRLFGDAGNDRLVGGPGNDFLIGGGGSDVVIGKSGNDRLLGKSGNDTIKGGGGDDLLKGQKGNDVLRGGAGHDTMRGGGGNDRLFGGNGDDRLVGGGGKDRLVGKAGDDRLMGGGARDILNGGKGDDFLNGGAGHDRMTGGPGSDTFVFNGGIDVITDWRGNDRLQLDDRMWAGSQTEADLLARNVEIADGGLYLRFGDGNRLFIDHVSSTSELAGHIDII